MVEKIIIAPQKVRGLGNIIMEKDSEDFVEYLCDISEDVETINGVLEEVFTLSPDSSHSYALAFGSSSYVAVGGSAEVSVTLTDGGVAVSGSVVTFTGGSSTVTATTNSSGVATATISVTEDSTITASFNNVTATCTVTVQTGVYYANDFSDSSTLSDFTDGQGTITKSISNGELVLTAPSQSNYMTYCNKAKIPKGDWKVTIDIPTYNFLGLLIGYDPNEPNNTCFDITWDYGWGLKKIGANWSETTVKSMSRISLGTNGVWIFEYVNKVMKIYQNNTLKATYDLNSYDTIGGYVVVGDCCNRTNNISELIIEEL